MPLIDAVKAICDRLASNGWAALLAQHGLNITSPDLAAELNKKLTNIVRSAKGFEDFALEPYPLTHRQAKNSHWTIPGD